MNWNKLFTFLAYGALAAGSIIATAGLAVPAWLIPVLGAVGTISGKMAASHSDSINQDALIANAAGSAAAAANTMLIKKG